MLLKFNPIVGSLFSLISNVLENVEFFVKSWIKTLWNFLTISSGSKIKGKAFKLI